MTRGKAAALRPAWPALMCTLVFAALSGLLSGCGGKEHASPYAAAVFDDPPVYCYRTIGDADCYARPLPGAEQRLVNYYGPPPDDYERPPPPPAPRLHAPPLGSTPAPAPEGALPPAPEGALPPAPAAEPANQPTMLFPSDPPASAKTGAGEGAGAATPATAAATTATATASAVSSSKPAATAGAEKPAMPSPRPRPATSSTASSPPQNAPLVIEVEGH